MRPLCCVLAGLLLGLTGCPAPIDGGGEPGGGGEPQEVSGTAIDTYITVDGDVDLPRDLRSVDIAALVPVEGGGFRRIAGSGTADGKFRISGVPMGTYYLKFGTAYIVTAARTLDLGQVLLGRPDRVRPTISPTLITFNVDQMQPWQASHNLAMYVPASGSMDQFTDAFAMDPPAPGATSLRMSVNWARAREPYLIDGSKGDRLHLLHLVGRTSNRGTAYQGLGQVYSAPPFSLGDGQQVTLTGSFRAVPQDRRSSAIWQRSQFEALRTSVNPSATLFSQSHEVLTAPRIAAHGDLGAHGLLAAVYPSPGATDLETGEMLHGSPFPADWTVVTSTGSTYLVGYQLPGAAVGQARGAIFTIQQDRAGAAVAPLVGPVVRPQIAGRDAFMNLTGVGDTPTLSWSPPARGTATGYLIFLYRLFEDNGNTRRTLVATLRTAGTSVTLPPELVERGRVHTATIVSQHRPGVDIGNQPFRKGLPEGGAACLLGTFTP